MQDFHLHLVSDSTGETVTLLARACLVQFDDIQVREHLWPLVRTVDQVLEVMERIREQPGFVMCTLVDEKNRQALEEGCRLHQIPCIPVLDPVVAALGAYLNAKSHPRPGRQHAMDAEYFARIEAMQFALSHDDGQMTHDLANADVVLLGVSRTSKTPTCIYLANRGIKAANIPFVPGCPLPDELFDEDAPVVVGLTNDPKRLIEIRRQRLRFLDQDPDTDYVDEQAVKEEVASARRLFSQNEWPVINVSRRSIEETAATILQLLARRSGEDDTP
ncbi:MAG: kinase/pyrophosphorylase [Rhodospirillales bacterium]|jgi:[pyruvate, water dikinase]-phosphate phosphotransferase / [pyruvate, water dikinase] kinase|nr:kinase/pyrophosphorylase [Rhodospirillales bacterium]